MRQIRRHFFFSVSSQLRGGSKRERGAGGSNCNKSRNFPRERTAVGGRRESKTVKLVRNSGVDAHSAVKNSSTLAGDEDGGADGGRSRFAAAASAGVRAGMKVSAMARMAIICDAVSSDIAC